MKRPLNLSLKKVVILLIAILPFFNQNVVFGGELDSLLNLAVKEKDVKNYNIRYLEYVNKLSARNRDSAAKLLLDYEVLCKKRKDEFGYARSVALRAWFKNYEGLYEEGIKLLWEAIGIQKRIGDSSGLANSFNKMGVVHLRFNRLDYAEKYLTISANYFLKLTDTIKIDMCYNNLGILYGELKKYDKSIEYFHKTVVLREKTNRFYWVAYAYFNIAATYETMNQKDSASLYFEKALFTFKNRTENGLVPPMVSVGYARFLYNSGNYKLAEYYGNLGMRDAKEINHKEVLLSAYSLLSDVYSKLRKFENAFNSQLEYIELKEFIDSSTNVAQIAEIEEKYNNSEKEVEIAKLKTENLEVDNKAKSFRLYFVSLVFVLIVAIGIIWFFWQKRSQSEKLKAAELNAKIAEAKMFALKAQMNPHFIFNCINTAQNFVLNEQTEKAFEYLSNFAKLFRLVMENSAKPFIPLEDELQQIRLYIELESIRFERKFTYKIFVDPELEQGVFEVPGMVLQPIIENAIGHGLINRKTAGGELSIEFSLLNDLIHCEIVDNGVGRKVAAEIKAKKSIHYSSAAIPNIKERLIMLSGNYHMEIVDLYNDEGASGTKVILDLPYK